MMSIYPESLKKLISQLEKLPNIGTKTAQRLALFIINMDIEEVKELSSAIMNAKEKISKCPICECLTENGCCRICNDETRDKSILCVVENQKDVIAIEKTGFRGLYHILSGALSPIDNINPEKLNINSLIKRITNNTHIKEVIIATNPNASGDMTALYLAKLIKPTGIKITRIACGIPVGTDVEYADEITLSHALSGRKEL
jgi:recombination protein RecR